jgi:hypothetical protein
MAKVKAPAFQFYPGDWIQDTRVLSLAAKGAWIDILCAMWRSQTRGMITLPLIGYSRLIGATVDQTKSVISELVEMGVCDCRIDDENVTCNADVTNCNGDVTLINRRMYSDEINRNNGKLRVAKYRKKLRCNGDVTPLSSDFSLQTSLDLSKDKSTDVDVSSKHFSRKAGDYLQEIVDQCRRIQRLPPKRGRPFNPFQWVQKQINSRGHPGAISKTLAALIEYWDTTKTPYEYARNILKTKNGNWNEKDQIRNHEEIKTQFQEIMAGTPQIIELVAGISN